MPQRTECRRGHDLTNPANVILKPGGQRQCRPCHAAANRARHGQVRQGIPPSFPQLPPGQTDCVAEGCTEPRCAAGRNLSRWCSGHQKRHTVYGEPFADVPLGHRLGTPLPESRAELRNVLHPGE